MKNRAGLVASVILLLAAGILLWNPMGWDPNSALPLLAPPAISRAADAQIPAITNSFGTAPELPKELSDDTFRRMMSEFSEPNGSFRYENFLSNESSYQDPIANLKKAVKPGGVYLGVGPEQNFTYIAATRPQMAFIIDIRRQNLVELMMYKALFEIARNRAEFVSMLFSRGPLKSLDENATAQELFDALAAVPADSGFFKLNLERIKDHLRLSRDDEKNLEYVYRVFFSMGPDLSYSSTSSNAPAGPSYANLMTYTDRSGENWSYLASEERFRFIKDMQRKNMIVPLVGDFAGVKAIRSVARYVKDHEATVSAFYLSNVEMYILPYAQWKSFCRNVADLPVDSSSTFIRFVLGRYAGYMPTRRFFPASASVLSPMIDVLTGVTKGYAPSYVDLIHASR